MIGGIIGDLAADTYLRDKATFYRQLFDDKALLSEYGLSVIATSTYLFDHPIQCDGDSIDDFRMHFRNEFSNVHPEIANLSEKAKDWIGDYGFRYEGIFSGMMLARLGTAGWYENSENISRKARRSNRPQPRMFQVDVENFDNEVESYEIEAYTMAEAAEIAQSRFGADAYNMNIYSVSEF